MGLIIDYVGMFDIHTLTTNQMREWYCHLAIFIQQVL